MTDIELYLIDSGVNWRNSCNLLQDENEFLNEEIERLTKENELLKGSDKNDLVKFNGLMKLVEAWVYGIGHQHLSLNDAKNRLGEIHFELWLAWHNNKVGK